MEIIEFLDAARAIQDACVGAGLQPPGFRSSRQRNRTILRGATGFVVRVDIRPDADTVIAAMLDGALRGNGLAVNDVIRDIIRETIDPKERTPRWDRAPSANATHAIVEGGQPSRYEYRPAAETTDGG